ncbi:glucan 1,4-a-glucosidase [Caballeronia arationis]|jgi:glucoamylase|uniref:glycoside hydrolase family 15 protein n=1 Tax=Caballeronia arationis TaxID=1777142 RepID=UPI00074BE9EA|nr:glucan 1,4-a-glucosidase [Caballeronia arationis]
MKLERVLRWGFAVLAALMLGAVHAQTSGEAFGSPGATALHGPARKSLLGTALTSASQVYFTGYRGIVSEVYYPVLDTTESVDLQFLVGDAAGSFIDEEKLQSYTAAQTDPHTMSWQVTTGNVAHNWQVDKTVYSDPKRSSLIERVTFRALNGTHLRDHNLYLLSKPHIDNAGSGNTAWTATAVDGRTMLLANRNARYSALAVSLPWKVQGATTMVSNGFVAQSDGWTDLLGGATADRKMDWTYSSATAGNVAQMGWLDSGEGNANTVSFDVVLSFDSTSAKNAMQTAAATLGDNLDALRTQYDAAWHAYASGLSTQGGSADNEYYLAAMTLKTMQDRSNGAMIAGIGTPWGETQGDGNLGGYHLVWSRDLFKFANALITAGDAATPAAVVHYLFDTHQQKTDCGTAEYDADGCSQGFSRVGRFPQNSWVSGWPYWQGTQMDEQAMPILLAWRLGPGVYDPLWPQIRLTADYILDTGPWTYQDRWEENSGYSPSTIAAEVAGLVAAARIAGENGDNARAGRYLSAADYWQQNVTRWTFTSTGFYGSGRYYVRINPANMGRSGSGPQVYEPTSYPDSGQNYLVKNGGGTRDERAVVDGGFLELVRMGVKRADDPAIVSTLAAYDAVLATTIKASNQAWFRYNFDGYGEHNDGSNFDGTGVGRAWPIFTAERGMYSIARSGTGSSGAPYLDSIKTYATPEGFIPEQIWTKTTTLPDSWQVVTPTSVTAGAPTGSMAPLNWAMGEYISLLASIQAGRVVDIPAVVCARYGNCVLPPSSGETGVTINVNAVTQPGQYVYVTGDNAMLGNWNTDLGLPLDPARYPVWSNTVNLRAATSVQYKYYRKNADGSVTWENLPGGGNRTLNVPASGTAALNDGVGW